MERSVQIDVAASGAENAAAPEAKKPLVKIAVMVLVLGGALAIIQFSPIKSIIGDTARVRAWLGNLGIFAYPAVLVCSAILIGCGFPRLVLCAAAAAILGFWKGLLLTQFGALLGYYTVFCFIRWGGAEWVIHRRPKLKAIAQTIQGHGVAGVILARQIPLHGTLINLCLGLSGVKHRHYLIGTAIGLFPEAVPVALVGSGLVKGSLKESSGWLALACVCFALLWIGSGIALKKLRQRQLQQQTTHN